MAENKKISHIHTCTLVLQNNAIEAKIGVCVGGGGGGGDSQKKMMCSFEN